MCRARTGAPEGTGRGRTGAGFRDAHLGRNDALPQRANPQESIAFGLGFLLRRCGMRYNYRRLGGDQVGVMQSRWQREYPTFLPIEARPLPPAFLKDEAPPAPPPRRKPVWLVVGIGLAVGFAGAGGYYWYMHRGQQSLVAAAPALVTPPPATPVKPAATSPAPIAAPARPAAAAVTPPTDAGPQLAVGLRPLSAPTPAPAPPPPPAPAADQAASNEPSAPVQLESGLKPITPPPAPVAQAPAPPPPAVRVVAPYRPPAQPRPAVNRLPPSDNPASSGMVRF